MSSPTQSGGKTLGQPRLRVQRREDAGEDAEDPSRGPQDEEAEPGPHRSVEVAFSHGCPAGPVHRSDDWAQVTSVVPHGSECSSSPSSPPTVARLRGEGAVRTAPTRGHQGAGRNAGAGEGGVHPGCPAHSLGLSPDYPMSPDRPGKGFPTALSETQNLGCGWGSGREAWHRGAVLPASLGPAPLLSSRTVTPVPPTCHQPQPRCRTPHGIGWHWGPGDGAHTWHPPPAPGTPAGLRAAGTLLWPAVGRP